MASLTTCFILRSFVRNARPIPKLTSYRSVTTEPPSNPTWSQQSQKINNTTFNTTFNRTFNTTFNTTLAYRHLSTSHTSLTDSTPIELIDIHATKDAYDYFRYGDWELQSQSEREQIASKLRFETSKVPRGEVRGLEDYVRDMKDDQKEIYYHAWFDRRAAERSPYCEALKNDGVEVLYLQPEETFLLENLNEFDEKTIVCAEQAPVKPIAASLGRVLLSPLPYDHWPAPYRFLWMWKTTAWNMGVFCVTAVPVSFMFMREVCLQMVIDFKRWKKNRKAKKLERKMEKKQRKLDRKAGIELERE